MPEREPTCIGRVRHVLGAQVTVALDTELAGVAPIFRGQLQRIGQIGSIVRIPQGLVDLVGQVSLLGIAELSGTTTPVEAVQVGERWLQVELLGEIDRGTRRFHRGVGTYPGLDDPVHFSTPDDLRAVFPPPGEASINVGKLAASEEVPVCVTASPFVTRHSVVVGSTGSGKTSCVASMLQKFARGGWEAANIVVIDPHGEYPTALGDHASVRSVLGSGAHGIRVPFWALPAADILSAIAGTAGGPTTQNRFTELVTEQRRTFAAAASWLSLDPSAVTADTPIPFDLRSVWHQLDAENNETRATVKDPTTAEIEDPGDPATLTPTRFSHYGPGGAAPHKGPFHGTHATVPELLRLGLLDPRLMFLQQPEGDPDGSDPLVEELANWLGRDRPVSILDFSGVPQQASDVAIGVILSLIFEAAVRTPSGGLGVGRPRPVLIVLEEAHRYLGEAAASMARTAANRIAREGRKYGVGLMLVTQRPSELPDTALAQSGTLVALRLSNAADQAKIRAALPDSVAGLAAVLPSLRTGEAVITGEAIALPARTLIDPPEPFPNAHDPSLDAWRQQSTVPDVSAALKAWRGVYNSEEKP
ncbi:ATP-binding protein [Solicola sp. PLA-1-18]|uniref:ATP-binding protein n=1 Tax=Solicola sp. PLA-1-18 TaxID=3380532 RepID=UPI003B7E3551